MNTFSSPTRAHHPGAAANAITQRKQAQPAFQFKDNRPEAIMQRKVQDMANKHQQAKPVAQMQAMEEEAAEQTEAAEPEMLEEQEAGIESPVQRMTAPEAAGQEEAPVQMAKRNNFSPEQRDKILTKNFNRNGGFFTCEEPNCGFQHGLKTYATHKGRRTGDGGFHVDHIHAAANGGRALIRNGRVLCGTCNTSKGKRANARKYGINKYRGQHRKLVVKNYQNMRRNY